VVHIEDEADQFLNTSDRRSATAATCTSTDLDPCLSSNPEELVVSIQP
jgi:hypothetical protein